MKHLAEAPACAAHLANSATDLLLQLWEDDEQGVSSERRRCVARLVALVSAVAPSATQGVYCLDRFEEVPATELQIIGEELQPVESIALSTQPQRWMRVVGAAMSAARDRTGRKSVV